MRYLLILCCLMAAGCETLNLKQRVTDIFCGDPEPQAELIEWDSTVTVPTLKGGSAMFSDPWNYITLETPRSFYDGCNTTICQGGSCMSTLVFCTDQFAIIPEMLP